MVGRWGTGDAFAPQATEAMASDLHVAVQVDIDHARALLQENPDDLEYPDYDGGTPLHGACGMGHESCTRLLLDAGAERAAVEAAAQRSEPGSEKHTKQHEHTTFRIHDNWLSLPYKGLGCPFNK